MFTLSVLAPLVNGLINIGVATAAIIVPPLLGALVFWALKKIGLANAQTQTLLSAEANKGFALSLDFAKGPGEIAVDKYLDGVRVPDGNLARAAAYAIAHWPDTFSKLGVDVTTPQGQQTIVRALTARLGAAAAGTAAAIRKA
jgi:hypothetical protein